MKRGRENAGGRRAASPLPGTQALPPFPPDRGLVFYWFLNDHLDAETMRDQLRAFSERGAAGVVLHPHDGLLTPYAGDTWYRLMRTAVEQCADLGLQPWLYDEDYCPSGSAGGRLLMEHPELAARNIERFEAPDELAPGELFAFPAGKLIWAGQVPPPGCHDAPVDLTAEVGVVRRAWDVAMHWDSRYYYAQTPVYPCPRGMAHRVELALLMPPPRDGWRTVVYVAQPVGVHGSPWGGLVDSLNPEATEKFIAAAYEPWARIMGAHLGTTIPCIYTDEAKIHGTHPYTPGMFEAFAAKYGYDLRPRLEDLYTTDPDRRAVTTRLHFRLWAAERFERAWLAPIARWCRDHDVALVGHLSPEEDLVYQSWMLGNLLQLEKHFPLPGLDLIIPAVGDRAHPMMNVAPLVAISVQQQQERPAVMCETFGAFAMDLAPFDAGRILAWQVTCGVNMLVAHAAFYSNRGLRAVATPPDLGPHGRIWEAMGELSRQITPFELLTRDAAQAAPLAIVYPIRSFYLDNLNSPEARARQAALHELLMTVLEAQVGVHFLDEEDIPAVKWRDGALHFGRARYQAVLVPPMTVVRRTTFDALACWQQRGIRVASVQPGPTWCQDVHDLVDAPRTPWPQLEAHELAAWCAQLPGIIAPEARPAVWLRSSVWQKDERRLLLACNIDVLHAHQLPIQAGAAGETGVHLAPGEVAAFEQSGETWQLLQRFDPASLPAATPPPPAAPLCEWQVQWPESNWQPIDYPLAAYQLRPGVRHAPSALQFGLTGTASVEEEAVAESLTYRARVDIPADAMAISLTLHPTAIRGQVAVQIGDFTTQAALRDADRTSITLDLRGKVASGPQEIRFTFAKPAPLDGIRLAPEIRLEH